MRFTSRGSGSGDTNSRHSLAVMNSAVAGCASRMSSTASPSKLPDAPEHRLVAVVVNAGPEQVFAGIAIEAPAGERTRRFLDVLLGVVALAEREELHDLAREILVRLALAVLRAVEVDEHRRVLRRRVQQRAEVAQRIGAQHRVLRVHEARDRAPSAGWTRSGCARRASSARSAATAWPAFPAPTTRATRDRAAPAPAGTPCAPSSVAAGPGRRSGPVSKTHAGGGVTAVVARRAAGARRHRCAAARRTSALRHRSGRIRCAPADAARRRNPSAAAVPPATSRVSERQRQRSREGNRTCAHGLGPSRKPGWRRAAGDRLPFLPSTRQCARLLTRPQFRAVTGC